MSGRASVPDRAQELLALLPALDHGLLEVRGEDPDELRRLGGPVLEHPLGDGAVGVGQVRLQERVEVRCRVGVGLARLVGVDALGLGIAICDARSELRYG